MKYVFNDMIQLVLGNSWKSFITLSVPVRGFETIRTIAIYVFETGAIIEA